VLDRISDNLAFTSYHVNAAGRKRIADSIADFCVKYPDCSVYETESYNSIIADISKLNTDVYVSGDHVFLKDAIKNKTYEILDKQPKVSRIFNRLKFYVLDEDGVKGKFVMKFSKRNEAKKEAGYHTRAGNDADRSVLNRFCIAYSIGKYLDDMAKMQ